MTCDWGVSDGHFVVPAVVVGADVVLGILVAAHGVGDSV